MCSRESPPPHIESLTVGFQLPKLPGRRRFSSVYTGCLTGSSGTPGLPPAEPPRQACECVFGAGVRRLSYDPTSNKKHQQRRR